METKPYTFEVPGPAFVPTRYDNHVQRYLTDLKTQFFDTDAVAALLAQGNPLLYDVYDFERPHVPGEVLHGISILHPGKVGREYNMTKGHFHQVLDTSEVYYVLKGQGFMVMETPEGDWAVEELHPGRVLYVLPRWAHRTVNVHPSEDMITLFSYPGHAGHDYGTIEQQGFRKLVLEENGAPVIVDNPRWQSPVQRARNSAGASE